MQFREYERSKKTFRKLRGIKNEEIFTSISALSELSPDLERAELSGALHCGVHKIIHNTLPL